MLDLYHHINFKTKEWSCFFGFNNPMSQRHYQTAKVIKRFVLLISLSFTLTLNSQAQYVKTYRVADSVYLSLHSAHRATFMSALVPGLGQIYNQKYWKVPILYAGFAGLIYYADYNNFAYNKYKDIYEIKVKVDLGELPESEDKYAAYSKEYVLSRKDYWRRSRDLCFISMGLLYVAQIIDASVDAHLFDYDITDDLSLRVEPVVLPPNQTFSSNKLNSPLGVRCSVSF